MGRPDREPEATPKAGEGPPYRLPCECGREVAVAASEAGGIRACACGRELAVPSLSRLRSLAGQGAYETGVLDRVARMLADGSLPWGDVCSVTGEPTTDRMEFEVVCESLAAPKVTAHNFLFPLLCFFGPILALLALGARLTAAEAPVHGRETTVRLPLLVAARHQRRLARHAGQRELRRLLATVPIFDELLRAYPGSRIVAVAAVA